LEIEQYRIELDEEVRRKFDVPLTVHQIERNRYVSNQD